MKFAYSYNYSLDSFGRCRWSTNTDEPLLFVAYSWKQLNILDVEKKALILKSPVKIESKSKHSIFFIFLLLSIGS